MNPLNHPAAHQIPENDVEKRGELKESAVDVRLSDSDTTSDVAPTPVVLRGTLAKWNAKVEGLAGLGTYCQLYVFLAEQRLQILWNKLGILMSTRQPGSTFLRARQY